MKKLLTASAIATLTVFTLSACEHGAEKTGEAVDNAAYSVKSSVQEATGTQGPAQSVGAKIDDATGND